MAASAHDLEIRLFGRFEVLRDGTPIPAASWGRRKTKTLLKVLLMRPGHVFTQDQLIEALYGGENPQAKTHNLRGRISELRHALEPELEARGKSSVILRCGHGYSIDPQACRIDTEAFRERMAAALRVEEAGKWSQAIEVYETGLGLYRGDLLEEDAYEEWSLALREELRSEYHRAMARVAHCYAQLHDFGRAGEWCDRSLALEPAAEPVIRQRMAYAYHAGEKGRALATYHKGVAALRECLSVDPSEETTDLFRQIEDGSLPKEGGTLDPLRIAVLPLMHIGPDSDDVYFADGLTEELISRISRVRDLRVIAQTSVMPYKGSEKRIGQIGRELRVGTALEGSVRRANGSLHIDVQVIDVNSEEHLWADSYSAQLTDVFGVQIDIANRIARALEVQLLSEHRNRLAQRPTSSFEAYDCYLRGRHFLGMHTIDGYEKAIEYFERALEHDPAYAHVYAGLSEVARRRAWANLISWNEGFAASQAYAEKALALDPELDEAHMAMAAAVWMRAGEIEKAESHLRKAIEINPSSADARNAYAQLLWSWNHVDEARREVIAAFNLDPVSPKYNILMAEMLFYEDGDLDGAIRYYRRALEIDPESRWARKGLAEVKRFLGDWVGAEHTLRELVAQDPEDPRRRHALAQHLAFRGQYDDALRVCEEASRLTSNRPYTMYIRGEILFGMRRFDEAQAQFERAIKIDPTVFHAQILLGMVYLARADYEHAFPQFERLESCSSRSVFCALVGKYLRAVALARTGKSVEARRLLARFPTDATRGCGVTCMTAAIHFALGEIDTGFECLERSLEEFSLFRLRLKLDPMFDCVHDDPRFIAILERIGLAE